MDMQEPTYTFIHSSMFGSYETPCWIISHGGEDHEGEVTIGYWDQFAEEVCEQTLDIDQLEPIGGFPYQQQEHDEEETVNIALDSLSELLSNAKMLKSEYAGQSQRFYEIVLTEDQLTQYLKNLEAADAVMEAME